VRRMRRVDVWAWAFAMISLIASNANLFWHLGRGDYLWLPIDIAAIAVSCFSLAMNIRALLVVRAARRYRDDQLRRTR